MIRLFISTLDGEVDLLKSENGEVIMPQMGKGPMEDSKTYTYQFPEAIVGFAHLALDTYSNEVLRHFNAICTGDDPKRRLSDIHNIFQRVWRQKIEYYPELKQKIAPENSELDPKWYEGSNSGTAELYLEIDGNALRCGSDGGFLTHGIVVYRKYKKVFA